MAVRDHTQVGAVLAEYYHEIMYACSRCRMHQSVYLDQLFSPITEARYDCKIGCSEQGALGIAKATLVSQNKVKISIKRTSGVSY